MYDWAVVWLPIITKLVEDFMNFHVSWYFRFRLGLGMNCHKRWLWMVNCSCVMDDNLIVIWIWVWCVWNYIIVTVNCETVGWVSHNECGKNLGRAQFFTYRLAVLRLPPDDLSVKNRFDLVGALPWGALIWGYYCKYFERGWILLPRMFK